MEESILTTIKEGLGIVDEYTAFDNQIIMHINSVFMILNQIGIGPDSGFMIQDKADAWSEFIKEEDWDGELFNLVRTYVTLKVKMIWDPPSSNVVSEVYQKQIEEFEYRLNLRSEEIKLLKSKKGQNSNGT